MEIEIGTQFGLRLGMADSLPSFSARRRKKIFGLFDKKAGSCG